jgi:peroxiredoxin
MERNEEQHNLDQWVDDRLATLATREEWAPDVHRGLVRFRAQRDVVRGRQRRWAWIAAGSLAACVSLMATPVTRAFAERCLSACVNETSWVRQILSVGSPGIVSNSLYVPETRREAPDFTLKDASDKPVNLSDFRGKVILLNFWATWCRPCGAEIPMLEGFQQAYANQGFVVLGVSMDDDGWKAVRPFTESKKMNYPVVIANDRISDLFGGLKAIPQTFIIDRQGRIAAVHVGLCAKGEYENDIQAVLKE